MNAIELYLPDDSLCDTKETHRRMLEHFVEGSFNSFVIDCSAGVIERALFDSRPRLDFNYRSSDGGSLKSIMKGEEVVLLSKLPRRGFVDFYVGTGFEISSGKYQLSESPVNSLLIENTERAVAAFREVNTAIFFCHDGYPIYLVDLSKHLAD